MAGIESDGELGEPALPPAALGANPFSPVAAASGNEQRLVQVLENLTTLVANQAAPREQGIRGRDLAKVLKAPEAFRPKDRDAELAQWTSWSWELEQYLLCLDRSFGAELNHSSQAQH